MDQLIVIGIVAGIVAIIAGLNRALWAGSAESYKRTETVKQLAKERGWHYLSDRGVVIEDPSKRTLPAGLRGSVLSAFQDITQHSRLLGAVQGHMFVLSEIHVRRPNRLRGQDLTIVGFEVPRVSPHILIVPKGSRFMGRLTLRNEYPLRPMELHGSGVEAYVPEGFAIESLQVLEPDTLELIRRERIVIELDGPSARFMWPSFLSVAQILVVLDTAARLKETLQGVPESQLTASRLSPKLRVDWLVRTISNLTFNQMSYTLTVVFIIICVIVLYLLAGW